MTILRSIEQIEELLYKKKEIIMETFENITVIKKANIYYEGKVSSRTILFADGSKKTLGLMLPGNYKFSTNDKEIIEILNGEADVRLAGRDNWKNYCTGNQFEVPSQSEFELKVKSPLDYCCSYIIK